MHEIYISFFSTMTEQYFIFLYEFGFGFTIILKNGKLPASFGLSFCRVFKLYLLKIS